LLPKEEAKPHTEVAVEREEEMVSDMSQAALIILWPVAAVVAAVASAAKPVPSVPVAPAVAAVDPAPAVALERTFVNYTGLDLTEALEVIMPMAAGQEKVPTAI
jgi:hypothetical protein